METCGTCTHWRIDSPVPWSDYRRCGAITTDQAGQAFVGVDNLAGELLTRAEFACVLHQPRPADQREG